MFNLFQEQSIPSDVEVVMESMNVHLFMLFLDVTTVKQEFAILTALVILSNAQDAIQLMKSVLK